MSDSLIKQVPFWPVFSHIRALVVLDGQPTSSHYASFGHGDLSTDPSNGDAYFGLSEFIATLSEGGIFGQFAVTKAHRDTDVRGAADIEHFRFDAHDLSHYDEIWLFGVAPHNAPSDALSDSELAALATFMDGGGGVFATGDHEDLGVKMNGRVPRVRAMRKWYFPGPGPNGEPVAPPGMGTLRIDTTQPNVPGSHTVVFDNQSDDVPQPITPRFYTWRSGLVTSQVYPHPVLCGPKGPIRVLPDHMHEGEVIAPTNLTASFEFGGKNFVEFPADVQGHRIAPEIIAWGRILPEVNISTEGAHQEGTPGQAVPRPFGVVGAYDGHLAKVGRVVVDSTWHHFFDINLIGDPVAPFPKTEGFLASASGQAALADIKSYYRNIGTWIARPSRLWGLFVAGAYAALRAQPLAMLVHPGRAFTSAETDHIGALAWDHLRLYTPPCTLLQVHWGVIVQQVGPVVATPWHPAPGDPGPYFDPQEIARTVLGHTVVALGQARSEIERAGDGQQEAQVAEAARRGLRSGLAAVAAGLERQAKSLEGLHSALSRGHDDMEAVGKRT